MAPHKPVCQLGLEFYLAEEERLRGQALSQRETGWTEMGWADGSVGKVPAAQTRGPVLESGTHEKSQLWQCLCWGGTRGHLALGGCEFSLKWRAPESENKREEERKSFLSSPLYWLTDCELPMFLKEGLIN